MLCRAAVLVEEQAAANTAAAFEKVENNGPCRPCQWEGPVLATVTSRRGTFDNLTLGAL